MRHGLGLLLLVLAGAAGAEPLGTAISYQGRLVEQGIPAEGAHDFQFVLYAQANGGAPLLPALVLEDLDVRGGLFDAVLDFGPDAFLGERVYLEIGVRPGASVGAFELLDPRQLLTPTPYALRPAAGSVGDVELEDAAVTAPKLADGAVSAPKLQAGAVGTPAIADAAVTAAKLAPDAFSGFALADGAVTTPKLADGAVATAKIADAAVTGPKLATDAVGAAQIADGAVATAELADAAVTGPKLAANAVGAAQLADNAVASAEIVDGSVQPQDLNLAGLAGNYWGVGGNAAGAGAFLGTTNGAPLELRSDVGVVVNGTRFNNNTEFTVRGSPVPVEPNADLGMWPRGATAFFNLSAIGTAPADAAFSIQSVGTSPFTGYITRLLLDYDGALRLGGGAIDPLARLHVTRTAIGLDAADIPDPMELVLEDVDAQLGLYSTNGGGGGSVIALGELDGTGAFVNQWGLYRRTTGGNAALQYAFGTSPTAAANPVVAELATDGAAAFGASATLGTGSFAFADGSSASAFGPTAANQFVVRATGGAALNGAPFSSATELTVNADSTAAGSGAEVLLRPGGNTRAYSIQASGDTALNTTFILYYRDPGGTEPLLPYLVIRPNGFATINPATSGGGYILPAFPFSVGTSGDTSNGNGAHVTAGGTWVNGSSRTFKEAFTAIDPLEVLARVVSLPVSRWRYRGHEGEWHLGPTAEDFHAAFGLGDDARYIGTVDADGVALAALKGMDQKLGATREQLASDNARLRAEVDELRARLARIEALVAPAPAR